MARGYFYLGASQQLVGRPDDALAAYDLSARLDGHRRPAVWENMAALHASRKAWRLAARAAGRAASLRPHDRRLAGEHGKLLFRAGDVAAGQAVLGRAAYFPTSAHAQEYDQAQWSYELGRSHELFGLGCGHGHTAINVNSNFSRAQRLAMRAWATASGPYAMGDGGRAHGDRGGDGDDGGNVGGKGGRYDCVDGAIVHGWQDTEEDTAIVDVTELGASTAAFWYGTVAHDEYGGTIASVVLGGETGFSDEREREPAAHRQHPACWASQRYQERDIVRVTLQRVTLSGNDAVISDGRCRVYTPYLGVQIPLHRNLPPPASSCATASAFTTASVPPGLPPTPRLPAAILAVQLFSVGYYHFLLDVLPRILLAAAAEPAAPILVAADGGRLHGFMEGIFSLLGLRHRVVTYNVVPVAHQRSTPGGHGGGGGGAGVDMAAVAARFVVDKLTLVDWRRRPSDPREDTQHLPPARALRLVRDTLAPAQHPGREATPTLLYIQRARAATRRLRHEAAALAMLEGSLPLGWRLRVFTDNNTLPLGHLPDDIAMFAGASVVVGVHGAGLANAVFCKPGSAVVEMSLAQPHSQYYSHLASALQLGYWQAPAVAAHQAYGAPEVEVDMAALRIAVDAAVAWAALHRGRIARLSHGL